MIGQPVQHQGVAAHHQQRSTQGDTSELGKTSLVVPAEARATPEHGFSLGAKALAKRNAERARQPIEPRSAP